MTMDLRFSKQLTIFDIAPKKAGIQESWGRPKAKKKGRSGRPEKGSGRALVVGVVQNDFGLGVALA